MSDITVKGYVNKPQTKTSAGGTSYGVFTLAERQNNSRKGQPPEYSKNYFNVTVFGDVPEENSFATVTGYLKFRKYTKDGQERTSYDIVAQSVETTAPKDGTPVAQYKAAAKDPWD